MVMVSLAALIWCGGWWLNARLANGVQSDTRLVQLLVPVIAAIGGVIFVAEDITTRLMISGAMILGGIFLVVLAKPKLATDKTVQND